MPSEERRICTGEKTVLQQIQIRTPHIVIPAQAGIQRFGIAAIFKYS
ncbi:hypothetical protein ACKJOL_09085 [Neisseria cinerea]